MPFILSHEGKCSYCGKKTEMLYKFIINDYDHMLCSLLCCYKFKNKKKMNERQVRMSSLIRR